GKRQLNAGDVFKLKMDLPQEINGKSQIEFDAKVAWCEKSKNTNLFSAGLSYISIEPVFSQLIDELVSNPMFNDSAATLPITMNFESSK
ncbi:MAG: PilZ domain-containing protein, partial [Candidatus Zixiibacteriota bacterium]